MKTTFNTLSLLKICLKRDNFVLTFTSFFHMSAKEGEELSRIMKYHNRKGIFITTIIISVLMRVITVVSYVLVGKTSNVVVTEIDFKESIKDVLIVFAIYTAVMTVICFLQSLFQGYATTYFVADIRNALYSKMIDMKVSYFDMNQPGALISRLSNDCTVIGDVYIVKLIQCIQNVALVIASLILCFCLSWRVSLAILVAFPIVGLTYYFGDKKVNDLWMNFNTTTTSASEKAEEVISSFRTVKSFDNELYEAQLYKNHVDNLSSITVKTSAINGVKQGIVQACLMLMMSGIEYYSCWLIKNKPNSMNVGDMTTFIFGLYWSVNSSSTLFTIIEDFRKAKACAVKILEILESDEERENKEGNSLEQKIKGKIEFKNVSFKYNSNDKYAVNDLSLTIDAGQTVAFVGESGCGKSTTLQLIEKFYEIESGEILIDGTNIKDLSTEYMRSQISIVTQEPVLFSMSVKENIKYSNLSATDEDVVKASEVGNAKEFIEKLPQKFDSDVKQTSLSGGQKQRIAISRAILSNAPILLLDEATAALDAESERLVQNSIEEVRKNRTCIIVAHRLTTVMNADKIFMFKNGKVVESGTHKELLEKNGEYSRLVNYYNSQ